MLRQTLVISSLALAMAQAHAAEAGKVIFVSGKAQVADKAGAEGAAVQEGELLSTGADGFLYVKTVDNGLFILRPNTQARIVSYKIDPRNPANTRIKLELISGVARSKSGEAVKLARQNFRFNTPVAAIGVRGTDFTVYTDQDTSRVAVLSGGVVVSGFSGGCRPEGGGPCEGAASRELFAAQRGQLIEVKRGDAAPQVMQSNTTAPDQVSPPRADEPVAKNSGGTTAPILDARKNDNLEKLVAQQQPSNNQPPQQPPGNQGPQQPTDPVKLPETPPVVGKPENPTVPGGPEVPVPPQLPEREIQWGRWVALARSPATISLASVDGADRITGGDYVIHRLPGREYVKPERGSVSFNLKGGEAVIRSNNGGAVTTQLAALQNGLLDIDFGKAVFTTSFDLVSGSETFKMMAEGNVAGDGRFANDGQFVRSQSNNMSINGVLSSAGGGSAAYVFERRFDENRAVSGVTYWAK